MCVPQKSRGDAAVTNKIETLRNDPMIDFILLKWSQKYLSIVSYVPDAITMCLLDFLSLAAQPNGVGFAISVLQIKK